VFKHPGLVFGRLRGAQFCSDIVELLLKLEPFSCVKALAFSLSLKVIWVELQRELPQS
jgi:hypothetical protein